MIFCANNIEYFAETFDAFYYFACVSGVACQIVSFLFQNRKFCEINTYLQSNIKRSKLFIFVRITAMPPNLGFSGSGVPCYAEAEKISVLVSKNFSKLLIITSLLIVFPPFILTLFKVFGRNESLAEHFMLPLVFELFFDVANWPTYLLAFLWQLSNVFSVAYAKKIVSVAFFTDCFQTIAVMRDLQLMAGEFNNFGLVHFESMPSMQSFSATFHFRPEDSDALKAHLKKFVQFNTELIK